VYSHGIALDIVPNERFKQKMESRTGLSAQSSANCLRILSSFLLLSRYRCLSHSQARKKSSVARQKNTWTLVIQKSTKEVARLEHALATTARNAARNCLPPGPDQTNKLLLRPSPPTHAVDASAPTPPPSPLHTAQPDTSPARLVPLPALSPAQPPVTQSF
jgi:hypothetical protein